MTSVNPAIARGAVPWWGQRTGREGFFVEEPQGEEDTLAREQPLEEAPEAA